MTDKRGGATPEQYRETVSPENPPRATAGPATVVAGMWYYLAPIAIIAAIIVAALFYWLGGDEQRDHEVQPTTGVSQEETPGGFDPAPRPDDTAGEREFRGAPER